MNTPAPSPICSAMPRAIKIRFAATTAAQQHEQKTGAYSYAYHCGVLEGHIDNLCRELDSFKPRALGRGERQTTYAHDGGELVVIYDFEPEEKGSWDEPSYPASVNVNSVYANGVDVQALLDGTATMESIEATCLHEATNSVTEARYEAAERRYEQRKEDALAWMAA